MIHAAGDRGGGASLMCAHLSEGADNNQPAMPPLPSPQKLPHWLSCGEHHPIFRTGWTITDHLIQPSLLLQTIKLRLREDATYRGP